MNLCSVTDENLISRTDILVREEREVLAKVLHHLSEIERRRLFSDYGYKSLFDMAVKRFGYSEDQAYRRIQAMRLLREIPEVEDKICSGELSLTLIGVAQTFFSHEKKANVDLSSARKIAVVSQLSKMSVREAEKVTRSMSVSPETLRPDRVKVVSEENVEMRFVGSATLGQKIEKLKGLLAHSNPGIGLGELFEKACDLAIASVDPAAKSKDNMRAKESASILKRRVTIYDKAKGACEICQSTYALEIDHIVPKAKGGSDDSENLRLLCRSCNQRAAIKVFGAEKMAEYLE